MSVRWAVMSSRGAYFMAWLWTKEVFEVSLQVAGIIDTASTTTADNVIVMSLIVSANLIIAVGPEALFTRTILYSKIHYMYE